nr:MAG TPA: hypothetical protein [Caudoviricetes sp.]
MVRFSDSEGASLAGTDRRSRGGGHVIMRKSWGPYGGGTTPSHPSQPKGTP